MKRVVLGVAVSVFSALPVLAADMPVKAPRLAPPAVFSWAGCYVGANVGAIRSRDRADLSPAGTYLNVAAVAAPPNAVGTGLLDGDRVTASHSYRLHDTGITGGVQYGCNFQGAPQLVFGFESDINFGGNDATVTAAFGARASENPLFTVSPQTDSVSLRLRAYSTSRVRAGWLASERVLLYVTGGLAIGSFRSATNVTFTTAGALPVFANAVHVGSKSENRFGPTVGGGVEFAFGNNWSAKAEYLYMNFGELAYSSPLIAPAGVAPGYAWRTVHSLRDHVFRVGLNYKFGWLGVLGGGQ
jgi:outer membrane immunogenic protein